MLRLLLQIINNFMAESAVIIIHNEMNSSHQNKLRPLND